MIGNSEAYTIFKRNMEQHLDFVVLVCYAVPVLRRAIAATDAGSPVVPLSPPDHFVQRRLSEPQLVQFATYYENELARSIIISSFSYFEAYIKGLVKEFLAFHKGPEAFLDLARHRSSRSLRPLSAELMGAKRKLQEPDTKAKIGKYVANSRALFREGFRFPSELFSAYGVARVIEKVGNDKRGELKAFEIPALLIDAFHTTGFTQHSREFESVRKLRNEIAHGSRQRISLGQAVKVGKNLREWATSIDKHFVEHYFVLERYAP